MVLLRRRLLRCDNFETTNEELAMRLVRLGVLTALLPLFSLVCLAQDKNAGAIRGKVRVEKGSPSGVVVILRQDEHEITRVTSDKRGDFAINHVAPGLYSVTFRKPGLSVGTIDNVEVRAGKTRTLGDKLVLGIDEGSIAFVRGSVFNEAGRSVPGVRVELAKVVSGDSIQKLDARVTGETGEFVFRLPPDPAKYRLTVKADGAQPATKDVEVDSAVVYRVALVLKPVPK
jgi:Carboxypeptidase regulatory-like domain